MYRYLIFLLIFFAFEARAQRNLQWAVPVRAQVALYRILFQNRSKEAAIDEMKNGGYNFHRIYINITPFIKNVDVDELKKEVTQEQNTFYTIPLFL